MEIFAVEYTVVCNTPGVLGKYNSISYNMCECSFNTDLFELLNFCFINFEQMYSTLPERHLSSSKIWGFHGGDYEECHLLSCDAAWPL
jgi:hypothetical protein